MVWTSYNRSKHSRFEVWNLRLKRLIENLPYSYIGERQNLTVRQRIAEILRLIMDSCNASEIPFEDLLEEARSLVLEDVTYQEVEFGEVLFYAAAEKKQYGFILPDKGGDNIHFHLSQGIVLGCNGSDEPADVGTCRTPPLKKQRLVFSRVQTKRGFTCQWWSYEDLYLKALEDIKNRPLVRYRDIAGGFCNGVRWEGRNLDHLRVYYPASLKDNSLWDPDRFVFEKLEDGQWIQIKDPR